MSRPSDLPHTEHFQQMPCGTRAKYVMALCRCAKCCAANRTYANARAAAARNAASEAIATTGATPSPQVWTAPDGTKRTRVYARACPGVNGEPCRIGAHLRRDSMGGICGHCRPRLASVWNGLVSSDAVRAHLRTLSRRGVGYKSVAIAADVNKSLLADVVAGRKHTMRAQAVRRVLAIDRDALADHALVPAGPTWKRLRRLLSEGFSRKQLARRLGSVSRTPALQFKQRYVLAKTAARVERFYHVVMVA